MCVAIMKYMPSAGFVHLSQTSTLLRVGQTTIRWGKPGGSPRVQSYKMSYYSIHGIW